MAALQSFAIPDKASPFRDDGHPLAHLGTLLGFFYTRIRAAASSLLHCSSMMAKRVAVGNAAEREHSLSYEDIDRVLVTGASGFIGSAIVRAFLNAGFKVRALVRRTSPRANLAGLPIEIAEGSLSDKLSIANALKDVRYLVHAAADYRLWTRNPAELMAANVTGTINVMEEALKGGVEKIVYTSSVCTLAHASPDAVADETRPLDAVKAFNPYKRSKVLAEEAVRELSAKAGLPAVIVNPSAPVGPATSSRRRQAASSSNARPGGCPPMSTPASISPMWTT